MVPVVIGRGRPVEPALGALHSIDLFVTTRCNRRCDYCFLPAEYFDSGLAMSDELFASTIAWARRVGVQEVTLLGGEASLDPRLPRMLDDIQAAGLRTRLVTNGARPFRNAVERGAIGRHNLDRVAVSLDVVDADEQDRLRGRGAHRDAYSAIDVVREAGIPFDVNVTAVRHLISLIPHLTDQVESLGGRRVNIHWPSAMGLGADLVDVSPTPAQWRRLTDAVAARQPARPDFVVEVQRGFVDQTADGGTDCAIPALSNLQVFPDGRAYRCGLLVDRPEMASLTMADGVLRVTGPHVGEDAVGVGSDGCDGCPLSKDDRACIYDKVVSPSSASG